MTERFLTDRLRGVPFNPASPSAAPEMLINASQDLKRASEPSENAVSDVSDGRFSWARFSPFQFQPLPSPNGFTVGDVNIMPLRKCEFSGNQVSNELAETVFWQGGPIPLKAKLQISRVTVRRRQGFQAVPLQGFSSKNAMAVRFKQ